MPGESLRHALDANHERIAAGMRAAKEELRECEEHCVELRALIARGQAALGLVPDTQNRHGTLNEAMELILGDKAGGPIPAPEILAEVTSRDLYRTKAGEAPSLNQIHARVYHSPDVFERTPNGIRLRQTR